MNKPYKLVAVAFAFFLVGCATSTPAKARGCNPFLPGFVACQEEQARELARAAEQNRLNLQAHRAMQAAAQELVKTSANLEPRIQAQGNIQVQEAFTEFERLTNSIIVGLGLQGFPVDVVDGSRAPGIESWISRQEDLVAFRIRNNANANALSTCFLPREVVILAEENAREQDALLRTEANAEYAVANLQETLRIYAEILQALQVYNGRLQEIQAQADALRDGLLASGRDPFFSISSGNFLTRQLVGDLNARPDFVCATKASVATQLIGMTQKALWVLGSFVP